MFNIRYGPIAGDRWLFQTFIGCVYLYIYVYIYMCSLQIDGMPLCMQLRVCESKFPNHQFEVFNVLGFSYFNPSYQKKKGITLMYGHAFLMAYHLSWWIEFSRPHKLTPLLTGMFGMVKRTFPLYIHIYIYI